MGLTSTDGLALCLSLAAILAVVYLQNSDIARLQRQVNRLSSEPGAADDLVPGERKPPVGRRVGLLRRLGMRLRGEKPILLTRAEPW